MYVIADDLTGSNDTAIQYRNAGYSAIVPVLAEASSFSGFDLVAINTDSRMMSAEDSYRSVFAMVEPLKGVSSRLVYKKIDSQLRGNPGTELQAVMDCLGFRTAFIAPSFPKNGRVIAGGKLELPDSHQGKSAGCSAWGSDRGMDWSYLILCLQASC